MDEKHTILIVDDQLSVREVLRGLLTGHNYNLAFATNGKEGLAMASELTPDLILLDVMMPDMNGFEMCQRLRADPRLAELPVVMVTALDDMKSRVKGIEAGADDFLTKPINSAELLARTKTIIRLNRYRRLLTERAKFEWVVQHATDGYLILDDNDNILYANAQARHYLGLPTGDDEAIEDTFLRITGRHFHRYPVRAWAAWPRQTVGDKEIPCYLVRPETDTSAAFWLQVTIFKLPDESNGSWLVHLRNVTSQTMLQYEVWGFQSMVSHKLRTPLAGVVTGLDLLEHEGIRPKLSGDTLDLYELVYDSAHRLGNEVEEILRYLNMPTVAYSDTGVGLFQFERMVAYISTSMDLKDVTVSVRIETETAKILLTEQALELILRELFENAKKFHPSQAPKIDIMLAAVDNKKQAIIQIGDDGSNLSPEQLSQVWTPYYQGEKSFTGEVIGMGLGLSKVASLIWSVGGRCRIANKEPGPGILVELAVPLQP